MWDLAVEELRRGGWEGGGICNLAAAEEQQGVRAAYIFFHSIPLHIPRIPF